MPRKTTKKPKPEAPGQPTPASSSKPRKVSARLRFWRWPIVAGMMLVLSLLMLIALWTSFLNLFGGLEHRVRNLLIAYVSTSVDKHFDSRRISIVLIDQKEPPNAPPGTPFGQANSSHRRYHAQLIDSLAGKAKVVVFDMEFRKPDLQDPKVDLELAAAIERAEKLNTRILVGVDMEEGESQPIICPALKDALKDDWGVFGASPTGGSSNTFLVQLGLPLPNQREPDFKNREQLLIPSLALKAVEQLRNPNQNLQASYNAWTNKVTVRSDDANGSIVDVIPVDNNIYLAVDMVGKDEQGKGNSYPYVYAKGTDLSEFTGKIVVVGYQVGDEKNVGGSVRYGPEIQANAISNILLGDYISRLSTRYEYLIMVLMIVIAACLRLGFGKLANYKLPVKVPGGLVDKSLQIPVTLLVVGLLYLFVAILAYKLERKVFNVPYSIVALFLSYLSIGAVRARLGFN